GILPIVCRRPAIISSVISGALAMLIPDQLRATKHEAEACGWSGSHPDARRQACARMKPDLCYAISSALQHRLRRDWRLHAEPGPRTGWLLSRRPLASRKPF